MKTKKAIIIVILVLISFMAIFSLNLYFAFTERQSSGQNLLTDNYRGIVVDKGGRIYIGNLSKFEVDVFDPKGKFLYNLPCHTYGGFEIDLSENDLLLIRDIRENQVLTYHGEKLISTKDVTNGDFEVGSHNNSHFTDDSGNTFNLVSPLGNTQIIETDKEGEKHKILSISTNLYAWFVIKTILIILLLISGASFAVFRAFRKFLKKRPSS